MREHRLLVQAGSACHRRVRRAGRIVNVVVVSSAGEDVLDSLEAGIEYLTDALGDLRVGLSLTELPAV